MRADWEELPSGDIPSHCAGIYATMNPRGHIVLSRVTHQMLGEPKAFVIFFDKVNNRIGLKPAALATRNAYLAGVRRNGAKIIRAYRLLREYRINLPHTVQFYDADIDEEGMLVLDLRTAKISRRAANNGRTLEKRLKANGSLT